MSKDTIKENIIIDLDENSRSLVPVSKSFYIEFPPRNFDFFGGGFLKRLAMNRTRKNVEVGIRDLKASPELVLVNGKRVSDLFSLMFDGEECSLDNLPRIFTVQKDSTPFQLYFEPRFIRDCRVKQNRVTGTEIDRYKVSGEAFVRNEKHEDLDVQPFEITIEFKELVPQFSLSLAGPRGGSVKYNDVRGGMVEIGEIRVTNPQFFERSPYVDFSGRISIIGPDGRIMEDVQKGEAGSCPRVRVGKSNDNSLFVKKILSKRVNVDGKIDYMPERFPVYMDFSDILNPLTSFEKFTIKVDGSWALSYSPDILNPVTAVKEFRLMKDTQGTELRVSIENKAVDNGAPMPLKRFSFIPGDSFQSQVRMKLSNIATDSSRGGSLKISLPRITSSLDREGMMLFDSRRRSVDINEIITLQGDSYEEMYDRGFLIIKNGEGAEQELLIHFDPHKLFSLHPAGTFDFRATTTVEFDYFENSNGVLWDEVERKTFKAVLHWDLSLLPYPGWLALDYGSSAIVCMYDGKLLDLSKRRRDILALEKDKKMWKVESSESERETKFVSSELLFNTITDNGGDAAVSALCSEQSVEMPYSRLAVCLSPTHELIKTNYQRNLPCLKLLVGNQTLPENPDYDAYAYRRVDDNGNVTQTTVKESRENDEVNSLSKINTLFDEAYKIVFRYYLSHEIADMDRVNRLVLTYPNSYTPEHLKVLENIATGTFGNIRPGYLRFVSESDAVAAYYMEHWKDYNEGGDMTAPENILVYDMGAGTLDLTYLTKRYDKKTGTYTLDIKGKLGISKAGNYLDFVLAQIVDKSLAKTTRPTGMNADRTAKSRIDLKESVKNQLKPALSSNPSSAYRSVDGTEISIADVLNNKLLQNYLRECTQGVIDRLRNYLTENLVVDTVILSGRSCRLKPLKEALEMAMSGVRTNRLDGIRFKDLALPGMEDRQKTAVVEGAVTYAGSYSDPNSKVRIVSRRLYASFGVAFKTLGGDLVYTELANHSDMPSNLERGSVRFDEKVFKDMTHTKEVTLIQSYLSEADTLERLRKSDYEYLSEMSCFKLDMFSGQDELRMAVGIDRNNRVSLYVNGNPAHGEAPKGIDLNNEITKQSIWPATI